MLNAPSHFQSRRNELFLHYPPSIQYHVLKKNTEQFTLFTYMKKLDHVDIINPLARFQIKPIPTKHILFTALVELPKNQSFRN